MSTYHNLPLKKEPKRPFGKKMIWMISSLIILILFFVFGLSYYITHQLIHPSHKPVTLKPSEIGLSYTDVSFKSHDGKVTLKGWEMRASHPTNKWIITSHGYTGNRLIWPTVGSPKGEPGLQLFKFFTIVATMF